MLRVARAKGWIHQEDDGFVKNERVLVELLVELVKDVVLTMKVHVESRHVVGVLDVEGLGFVGRSSESESM